MFREWRALRPRPGAASENIAGLEVCEDHRLAVADGLVCLEGPGSAVFFERAEEVEECKVWGRLMPRRACVNTVQPAQDCRTAW